MDVSYFHMLKIFLRSFLIKIMEEHTLQGTSVIALLVLLIHVGNLYFLYCDTFHTEK